MKKVCINSSRPQAADSAEATAKSRHQNLLQDYLVVQKDFVTKKKKLQAAKQKRETLEAEVRFLRRRYKYLLELQSIKTKSVKQVDQTIENSERNHLQLTEAAQSQGTSAMLSNSHLSLQDSDVGTGGTIKDSYQAPYQEEQRLTNLVNNKTARKKKISWQEPIAL